MAFGLQDFGISISGQWPVPVEYLWFWVSLSAVVQVAVTGIKAGGECDKIVMKQEDTFSLILQ